MRAGAARREPARTSARGGWWIGGALVLLSLSLQGCEEEMEICVMKSFPTAYNNENDLALGGFTGWRETTERMPHQCCQALRTYITYMHGVKKNPKQDDPRTEVINEAKKEADQKTIEQRVQENPNDAKAKEAQAANEADAKRNAEQGKGGDPADPNTVTETQHTTSPDKQVEEIREEDGMVKLTKELEAAFCPMECPRKVVGDSELKKAMAKMCEPTKSSSLFETGQLEHAQTASSLSTLGSSLRATSFIQSSSVFDSLTGAAISSVPRLAETRKAAYVTVSHAAASLP